MQTLSDVVEIKLEDLSEEEFIEEKVEEIRRVIGEGIAINALSGGVDSSVVTMLGHRAIGDRLRTIFVDSGIMRQGEPEWVHSIFKGLGVDVEILDAQSEFFGALKGLTDPEQKREAVTQTFYKTVFGKAVKESAARYLLQGTNYTDIEETVAGIKRQHNILEQLGIDTESMFGYKVMEPLIQLRKSGVRRVGKALGLPQEVYSAPPFPGPALATRVIGEVTPERVATVRLANFIVEEELKGTGAFQYLAILHEDRVTGIRGGERDFGQQIEVRCWDSTDAVTGSPTKLPFESLERLGNRIASEVPGVVSVTYNITSKPPSTIEPI
jgi:GMP synthase (glutamine-hydrolysing)